MSTIDDCLLCGPDYDASDAPWFAWQSPETCEPHRQAILLSQAERALRNVIPPRQQEASELLPDIAGWTPIGGEAPCIYLHGLVGRGKSYQAAALLKVGWMRWTRHHGKPPTIQWWQVGRLLQQMRASMGKSGSEDLSAALFDCDLLVLDDLGAERVTDWTREQILLIISERYDRYASTIITSNYSLGDLADRLSPNDDPDEPAGQRIASRIAESAMRIEVTGPDRRLGSDEK